MHYLQQVTAYVDTKDRHEISQVRHETGEACREAGEARRLAESLGPALNSVIDEFRQRLESALVHHEDTTATLTQVCDLVHTVQAEIEKLDSEQEGIRQSVNLLTAATHAMKREVERLSEPQPAAPAEERRPPRTAPDPDAYKYIVFEDRFRGTREDVIAAQRAYLPYFEGASDVLDIGCGRGEFLQVLREAGIVARGLDLNAEAIEGCLEQGFDATRADALEYVSALPDESVGGSFSCPGSRAP